MKKLIFIVLFFICFNLSAQHISNPPKDAVKTIDGIVKELLKLISLKKGEKADLQALSYLFIPNATFTVHSHNDSIPQPVETVGLQEFLELLKDPYYEQGFTEYELSKKVDEYNGIAHVFQTFYAKDSENEEEKGITSYQLVYFQDRWWIVNLLWTGDSNGVEVPSRYLN